MKATEIQALLNATVLVGPLPEEEILTACGSDMMSDVLAFPKDRMVLLTGLTNPHTVRTAELLDVMMIIFVRGKLPSEEVLNMAEDAGIAVVDDRIHALRCLRAALLRRPPGRNGGGANHERTPPRSLPRRKGRL